MEKYSDLNIEVKELKENDVILVKFSRDTHTLEEIHEMFYNLSDFFPKTKCLLLPDDIELEFQEKERIIKWLSE